MRPPEPLRALLAGLAGAPPPDADWPAVLAAANRALVTGLLADRIGEAAPEEVRTFLAEVRARAAARNARLGAQLAEALAALGGAGIRPILLKGAAILHTVGAGYGGRIVADLDLMVPAGAMAEAAARLHAIGYRDHAPPGGPLAARVLWRSADVGMIDLHARTKVRHPGFDHAGLAPRCTALAIGGAEALLPSPTDQALILILHDQLQERDYWRGLIDLRHLLDLAALAEAPGGIDWEALAGRFPAGYRARALAVQLATLAALLGVAVPARFAAGRWQRIQLARRLVQLRRPWLRVPLTLATFALDPPRHANPVEHSRLARVPLPEPLRRALSAGRRLLNPAQAGKL